MSDVLYGTVTGLLCAGVKALWATGLVLATRSTDTGPGSLDMGRMAVWGFLVTPGVVYISLMASYGASALWTGAPGGRWFRRPEVQGFLTPLPPDEITLAQSAGRGALGGGLGLASLSILIIASLVLCLVMVFLGPGLPVLLLWLGVVLVVAAACLLWGAMIGTLIFCRRQWGWSVGIAAAATLIMLCNVIIGHVI